ncbi:MAG TPA: CPBP family intramembrane glutamic endopeptidase [Thermoanaerobaculia bacterium]|nr:CPBP family intramembrane glutamic endopeptidase [Thermoanaerobaculia bacterium]
MLAQGISVALGSHVALDHVLVFVIGVVSPLLDCLWFFPRFQRATAAGVPGARARFYLAGILVSWALTGCVVAAWAANGRPWAGLGLGVSTPLRLAIGLALALAYIGLMGRQRRAILSKPERLDRLYSRMGEGGLLLPRTLGEAWGFRALSVTAGICEEVIFRGFVLWYVSVWAGTAVAVVISSIVFGFAHLYMGRSHVTRTAIVGFIFALIVLAAGSLWPAMLLHAVMDLVAGDLGYRALGGSRESGLGGEIQAAAN